MTTPTLLIDSRDPFGRADGGFARELALGLARADVPVTLLYVANGVLATRPGARGKPHAELLAAGVTLLVDDFSLRERGELAAQHGGSVDWVNCGLCVDERGAGEAIAGVRRGSPADFWQQATAAANTLVVATRD